MKILVVNAGSSSHKLSLFDIQNEQPVNPLWKGELDSDRSTVSIETSAGQKISRHLKHSNIEENLQDLIQGLWSGKTQVIEKRSDIECVGHRVVHGGRKFEQPTLINSEVKEKIAQLIPLAPLHNPADLAAIEMMEKFFPKVPQIAVFDTAFHAAMPDVAKTYPLPYTWFEEGIQRYGFHGISHEYCAHRVAHLLKRDIKTLKIINCHLGNGSSLCAIKGGKSIDTTMGLTPIEGLMMGTRCGSIDPGILLYLLREKKYSVDKLDQIINYESGLKGICSTSDMREVVKSGDPRAKLALDMYVYRLREYLGAYLVHLEGADAICFTAGIGENVPLVRREACRGLQFLGVKIDDKLNEACLSDQDISNEGSKVRIFVVHTQEEWMIAKACFNADFSYS